MSGIHMLMAKAGTTKVSPQADIRPSLIDVCGLWQLVHIEFEFESKNFLLHMHEARGCDLIVCWKHNWAECPLEVIELSSAMKQIG